MMNNENTSIDVDLNDVLKSMSDQIANQAREIAVLNATIIAIQKKSQITEAPASS